MERIKRRRKDEGKGKEKENTTTKEKGKGRMGKGENRKKDKRICMRREGGGTRAQEGAKRPVKLRRPWRGHSPCALLITRQ